MKFIYIGNFSLAPSRKPCKVWGNQNLNSVTTLLNPNPCPYPTPAQTQAPTPAKTPTPSPSPAALLVQILTQSPTKGPILSHFFIMVEARSLCERAPGDEPTLSRLPVLIKLEICVQHCLSNISQWDHPLEIAQIYPNTSDWRVREFCQIICYKIKSLFRFVYKWNSSTSKIFASAVAKTLESLGKPKFEFSNHLAKSKPLPIPKPEPQPRPKPQSQPRPLLQAPALQPCWSKF